MKRKLFKTAKFVLWNLAILLLVFGGAEAYLNYCLNHIDSAPSWLKPKLKFYYENHDRSVFQYLPACATYDSVQFYRMIPGECRFQNREFDTQYSINSQGFRDEEAALDNPQIIFLGDSYTMGWGVEQNETFPHLLESKLGLKTLNTGVSSYGTAREVASLARISTDSLRYLVVQFCPNDNTENKEFVRQGNRLKVSGPEIYAEALRYHEETTSYYPFKHLIQIVPLFREKKPTQPTSAGASATPERKPVGTAEAFLKILATSPHIPDDVRIIVFSLEAQHVHDGFNREVIRDLGAEYAAPLRNRMSFIDLTGKIDSTHRYYMDPHLNAAGHSAVADAISAHFMEMRNVPGFLKN